MLTVLLSAYFLVMGVIFLALPWSTSMIEWIAGNKWTMVLLGIVQIVLAWGIFKKFFFKSRAQYLSIKGGSTAVIVEENVILQYVRTYWEELFPEQEVPCSLSLKENLIHVTADLPHTPFEQQQQLLKKIDLDLTHLFGTLLGYKGSYTLSVRFEAS